MCPKVWGGALGPDGKMWTGEATTNSLQRVLCKGECSAKKRKCALQRSVLCKGECSAKESALQRSVLCKEACRQARAYWYKGEMMSIEPRNAPQMLRWFKTYPSYNLQSATKNWRRRGPSTTGWASAGRRRRATALGRREPADGGRAPPVPQLAALRARRAPVRGTSRGRSCATGAGLPPSILLSPQDCPLQSCCHPSPSILLSPRIAPLNPGLSTGLLRPPIRPTFGPTRAPEGRRFCSQDACSGRRFRWSSHVGGRRRF